MAVNLVHQVGRRPLPELLELSFAQFQADKAVVGLAPQVAQGREALAGYAEATTCHLGDFMESAALRRRLSGGDKPARSGASRTAGPRWEALTAEDRARHPGAGRHSRRDGAAALDPGMRSEREGPRRPC